MKFRMVDRILEWEPWAADPRCPERLVRGISTSGGVGRRRRVSPAKPHPGRPRAVGQLARHAVVRFLRRRSHCRYRAGPGFTASRGRRIALCSKRRFVRTASRRSSSTAGRWSRSGSSWRRLGAICTKTSWPSTTIQKISVCFIRKSTGPVLSDRKVRQWLALKNNRTRTSPRFAGCARPLPPNRSGPGVLSSRPGMAGEFVSGLRERTGLDRRRPAMVLGERRQTDARPIAPCRGRGLRHWAVPTTADLASGTRRPVNCRSFR